MVIVFWILAAATIAALAVIRLRAGLKFGLTGVCALAIAVSTLVYVIRGSQ